MSYEGEEEYLCENGHINVYDAFDVALGDPQKCALCGASLKWHHSIDQTNGVSLDAEGNIDDPNYYTISAPVKEIGFTDVWHVDHHGNKYATKLVQYEPAHSAWERIP